MSKLSDHRIIVPAKRYSDGAKQNQFSNETQHDRITTIVERECREYHFPWHSETAHTASNWDRKQIRDLADDVQRYNRKNPHPVTLILFLRWDRYFREAIAAVAAVHEFRLFGVEINAAEQWVDYEEHTDLYRFFFELLGAEKVSRDIGDHTKRRQQGKLERGYYPYQIAQRYYFFEAVGEHKLVRRTPAAEALKESGLMIMRGSYNKEAWRATGGEEIHGGYQIWRDQLSNEFHQARYKEYDLHFEPLWEAGDWLAIQRALQDRKNWSTNQMSLANSYLRDIVLSSACGAKLTSSPVRKKLASGKKKTYHYYVCSCKTVRHLRTPREALHDAYHDMVTELVLAVEKQQQIARAVKQEMAEELVKLNARATVLKRKVQDGEEMKRTALLGWSSGKISLQEKNEIGRIVLETEAEYGQVLSLIEEHKDIERDALASLSQFGRVMVEGADPFQMRDFTRMAFPEGLFYDAENGIFKTTKLNRALAQVASESTDYGLLKFLPPDKVPGGQVLGGRPYLSTTAEEDRVKFQRYVRAYGISA